MQRPASVQILGFLNIIFGAVGILGFAFSTAAIVVASPANPVVAVMARDDFYRGWVWATSALGLIMTCVLIGAGVGLLRSRPWARSTCIAYAIYALVMGVVGTVVNLVCLVGPLMAESARHGGPAAAGAAGGAIGGALGGCFGLVYPAVLLVFMFRKNVVDYFRSVASPGTDG